MSTVEKLEARIAALELELSRVNGELAVLRVRAAPVVVAIPPVVQPAPYRPLYPYWTTSGGSGTITQSAVA